MKSHFIWFRATLILTASLVAGDLIAQSENEHAKHHPATAARSDQPMQGAGAPMAPIGGGQMGAEMGQMMDEMMKKMGKPPPREVYPSLMRLSELPSAQREKVIRQAHARMTTATALMSNALNAMSTSAARNDYIALQAATERMRQGLAQFESGLATHRALAQGSVPRDVALRWFKKEMNLSPAAEIVQARSVFGGQWFHWISMAIIGAFALAMTLIYIARSRRAHTLVTQLVNARAGASPESLTGIEVAGNAPVPAPTSPPPASAVLSTVSPPSTIGTWSGQLRVGRIFDETPDVKTFRLAAPTGADLPFSFEPGQFLTVSVAIEGKTVKRSYSIASSPCCRGWCEVTVKKAPNGAVSGYLHEHVKVGDLLDASGPYGRFTFRGEAPSVVMIAGGVGITPLMSSIRFLTDQSWSGDIYLVYACIRLDKVIFREELAYLAPRNPNLHVVIILSDEPLQSWTGERGLVSRELLTRVVPALTSHRVHVCGPPPMMEAVKKVLADSGVPAEQIRTELFLAPERPAIGKSSDSDISPTRVECRFTRSGKNAPLMPDMTVLEAAEDVGVVIPYSCRQGFCGECKTRLLSGKVTMEIEDGLSSQDKAAGYILACQAKSQSSIVVEA